MRTRSSKRGEKLTMDSMLDIPLVFDTIMGYLCYEDLFALHCVSKRYNKIVNDVYRARLQKFLAHFDRHNPFTTGVDFRIRSMLHDDEKPLKYVLMPCSVIEQGYSYLRWVINGDFASIPLNVAHILVESSFLYGDADQFAYLLANDVPANARRLFEYSEEFDEGEGMKPEEREERKRKLVVFAKHLEYEKEKMRGMQTALRAFSDSNVNFYRAADGDLRFEFATCLSRLPHINHTQDHMLIRMLCQKFDEKLQSLTTYSQRISRMLEKK